MIYGTERTKPEGIPKILEDRKITFPVFLDPTSAFRNAAGAGVYPSVALLDREGKIAWEGDPFYRKRFADACQRQIEALLRR